MGDRINKGFLQEKLMYGCFARWPKNWPYCQGGHKAGFPCSCLNYFKPFFVLQVDLVYGIAQSVGRNFKPSESDHSTMDWQGELEKEDVIMLTKLIRNKQGDTLP